MPGLGRHTGHDALRAAFARVVPRVPQCHLVCNTHVGNWDDQEARATSDVVLLIRGDDGWSIQLVGHYHDVLHRNGDTWLFHSRTAEFA
jgi:predicted ABC-type transport system involved in lysophospholipase L1 biosynthesis ATPase subunit